MKSVIKFFIVFFAILSLSAPILAQEEVKEVSSSDLEELIPLKAEELEEGVITGEVTSLDATASTIAVKTEDGVERKFSVVEEETILWKGIEDIELSDVKEGDAAEIGYYSEEGGKLIASWVDVLIEEAEPEVSLPLAEETKIEDAEAVVEEETETEEAVAVAGEEVETTTEVTTEETKEVEIEIPVEAEKEL